jgi:dihydrofolate synthase/folylpolyglutamate synthase
VTPPGGRPGDLLSPLEKFGIILDLEAPRRLLAALGEPQRRFPVVLVAGTNGKGSTSALLAAIVQAAGYRTGLFTSPHLETVEERIRLNGVAIAPEALAAHLSRVLEAAPAPPTYFEALTAAGFLAFAGDTEEPVDLAIIEVGLGGRLDATNVADPVLAVITAIGWDHQEYLGNSLSAIAGEKAGILRSGRPAVSWIEDPEPASAVAAVARALGALHEPVPEQVRLISIEPLGWSGQRVRLATPVREYDLHLALLGAHQAQNLGLAVRAAEKLAALGFDRIDAEAIERGVAACRWPGRMELVETLPGRFALLDGAHNPAGAATLASFLAGQSPPVDLLFGVLANKDAMEMLALLTPHVRRAVLTAPPGHRSRDPRELATWFPAEVPVSIEPDPEAALERALGLGGELLVVCGSLYLLGEIRPALRRRFGRPAPPTQSIYISGS